MPGDQTSGRPGEHWTGVARAIAGFELSSCRSAVRSGGAELSRVLNGLRRAVVAPAQPV